MNKTCKLICIALFLCVGLLIMDNGVYASSGPQNPGYDPTVLPSPLLSKTGEIWSTVCVLIQMCSIACVVFAGLRYMMSSADQKADIKKGLSYLVIGAVLIFAAVSIIQIVVETAESVVV